VVYGIARTATERLWRTWSFRRSLAARTGRV